MTIMPDDDLEPLDAFDNSYSHYRDRPETPQTPDTLDTDGVVNDDDENSVDVEAELRSERLVRAMKAGLPSGLPTSDEDLRKADQVLAEELAKLSMNEHEEIMMDVVGFQKQDEREEFYDAAFINAKLEELERRINKIPNRKAYDSAVKQNPLYAKSKEFQMAFLRSKEFNVKATAQMIVNHFRVKEETFAGYPAHVIAGEVKFSDLSPSAKEFIEAGYIQNSPVPDASGRHVTYFDAGRKKFKSHLDIFQAFWYTVNNAKMRDESAEELKKVVVVVFSGGVPEEFPVFVGIQKLKHIFPGHIQAVHVCDTNKTMRFFLGASKLYMDNFTRFRLQEHSGTREEVNFALQTYGINTEFSPMKLDGSWDTTHHKKWLEEKIKYENQNGIQAILVPRRFDVLFGKNKKCMQHPGTLRCQLIVEMHWETYNSASKKDKGLIADKIVGIIHDSKGRFLKWTGEAEEGSWIEVDDSAAREKVTHYFRGLRERKQRKATKENNKKKRVMEEGQSQPTKR